MYNEEVIGQLLTLFQEEVGKCIGENERFSGIENMEEGCSKRARNDLRKEQRQRAKERMGI